MGNGTVFGVSYVSGGSDSAQILFAQVPSPAWTICALTRLISPTSGNRVLQTSVSNNAIGHYQGTPALFYQTTIWRSPSSYPAGSVFDPRRFAPLRWTAFCIASASTTTPIIVNGVDVRARAAPPRNPVIVFFPVIHLPAAPRAVLC